MTAVRGSTFTAWKLIRWAGATLVAACVAPAAGDTPGGGGFTGDGDQISNAVELNPPNKRLYNFDTTVNNPDPSRALQLVNGGTLQNGINLPDSNASYYHWRGNDPVDTDDWGTLKLLNLGEGVAQDWGDAVRPCVFRDDLPPRRFGILDLSQGYESTRRFGGPFVGSTGRVEHKSHQNGRDMDVRYLRKNGSENPVDIGSADSIFYDNNASEDLVFCFARYPNVELILVDKRYTNMNFEGDPRFVDDTAHHTHFHVRITDPDGTAN